ncbi:MAG: AAA family ATPase [Synergistaceae bacterium]|nr:AAA family ATPase [Synergistaceae bacterium]
MASYIKRIKIEGFRRLRSVDVEMSPFMVFVGANGSGKTSFLDAISLLSASASGRLSEKLSEAGGISSLLTRGKSDRISIDVDIELPEDTAGPGNSPLHYHLSIVPRRTGYVIAEEQLLQHRDENRYGRPFMYIDAKEGNIRYFNSDTKHLEYPDWDYDPDETALSQVSKVFRQPELFRQILASATQYHYLDVGRNAPVKMPQLLKPASLPGINGEYLIPLLLTMREDRKERFSAVTDALRAAFPGFEELNFPPVAAGMLAMTWKDRNFPDVLYANELSEGILRFLWLSSLLKSPGLSTVTMIDEPEVSLHPELLDLLSQLMREASSETQIIAATHSDRFVRFLEPEEVCVIDLNEDGETVITRADTMNLGEWLKDYSLDELWRMGEIGGRA